MRPTVALLVVTLLALGASWVVLPARAAEGATHRAVIDAPACAAAR